MPVISDALTTWILKRSTVTVLLNTVQNSVFTDKAGLNSKRPFIYIEHVSNPIEYQTSASKGMITLATAQFRLHCEAKTRSVAANIADKLRILFLNGFQGKMDTIDVRAGYFTGMEDRQSRILSGKEEGLPAVICDIELTYLMPLS